MATKFIPGIYNYCDRWCERCTFTSRCRTFEKTGNLSPEQLDINNKAFWDNIAANFREAIEGLQKMAKEKGIDLDKEIPDEEDFIKKRKEKKDRMQKHPLHELCTKYVSIINPFLQNEGLFKSKEEELVNALILNTQSEESLVSEAKNINNCYEIITWYQYFLTAKFQRALSGKFDDLIEEDTIQNDSNGSAKIALIGIEKSMAAWAALYDLLPEEEDAILAALAILQQVKQKAEEEFPDAYKFIRPGFDGNI